MAAPSSANQPFRTLAYALILATLCGVGLYKVVLQFPRKWASLSAGSDNDSVTPKQLLLRSLMNASAGDRVRAGASVPLAVFVGASGHQTTLAMAEVTFEDSSIEPSENWKAIGRRIVLVNSVDQNQNLSGGLSGRLGMGCGVPSTGQPQLNLGDVDIHPCRGVYEFHNVKWLANMAIVVWENPGGKPPCWNRYGTTQSDQYRSCVGDALKDGLAKLFDYLTHRSDINADALVLPALATNTGDLPKADFYERLSTQLLRELQRTDGTGLPPKIYLQVYSGEDPYKWLETRVAIADSVSKLVSDWNGTEHKNEASDWAPLIGVSGCLSLLLLIAALIPRTAGILPDVKLLLSGPQFAMVAGWFVASMGIAVTIKPLITLFPKTIDPWQYVLTAFLITPFCGPVLRVLQTFDTTVRPKDAASPNLPPSPVVQIAPEAPVQKRPRKHGKVNR